MEIRTNEQIHPNKVRQVMIFAVIILLGWILYREMSFMMGGFLGSVALYMLMRKPMFKMTYIWKMKRWLSALILIIASLVIIVLPFAFIIDLLIKKLVPLLQDPTMINNSINQIADFLQRKFQIDILSKANLEKLPGMLTTVGSKVVGGTLNMLANVVVMYFILWFMLVRGSDMERSVRHNLPLKNTNVSKLLNEVRAIVVSNAVGIPVLGLCQGVLAIIGYYLFGVDQFILWGIVTGIASAVPFVGTTLIWLPVALLAFARGEASNGYWLLLWGAVVIGSSDNVIRFILQKYMADIHPLITVFGVIVGLNLFGFFGLIFGPLLVSLFLLLVRIYNDEFISTRKVETITQDEKEREEEHSDEYEQ